MRWNSLIDRPLENCTGDSLSLKNYADAIYEFIRGCETPVTIGIQGDWGIGKTSLLNMLRENLAPRRGLQASYPTIYFNTWQYAQFSQEEFLGIAVLNGLVSEIERTFPKARGERTEKLKSFCATAWKFMRKAGTQLVENRVGVDLEKCLDQGEELPMSRMVEVMNEYKSQFAALVEMLVPEEKDRLVIMIDDLDRVKPIRALELLEATKNFLDVPGCVFILAVDYAVIQQGVKEKLGADAQSSYGKSYFDKIIQVPFNMPTASYQIDKYVMSLLGWTSDGKQYTKREGEHFLSVKDRNLSEETARFFANVTILTAGPNPRSIKRVVNYVNLLKIVCRRSREGSYRVWTLPDAKNLYALACMQMEWPELFSYFAENPTPTTLRQLEDWDFLESLPQLEALFKRAGNVEQLKSNISGFFDELTAFIDTNQDGEISASEFKPIWKMMTDANLTSAPLEDTEKEWTYFVDRAMALAPNEQWKTAIRRGTSLIRKSDWNNPLRFRLVSAGKRFHNVLWNGEQVGSIVTTRSEPFQFYLKVEAEALESDATLKDYVCHFSGSHYGIGETKVDILGILKIDDGGAIDVLSRLQRKTALWASSHAQTRRDLRGRTEN